MIENLNATEPSQNLKLNYKYSHFLVTYQGTLEKEMATHSSILTWRIPGTEEPDGLPPWGCTELDTTEVT